MHISGSIEPITLIWKSLKRSFLRQKLNIDDANFCSKEMTSEAEQGPRHITAGYGQHGVNGFIKEPDKLEIIIAYRHIAGALLVSL